MSIPEDTRRMEKQPLKWDDSVLVKLLPFSSSDRHPKYSPSDIVFDNLSVTVGGKTILEGIKGECQPGKMMAVMGASGSGKTTLLDALSGRRTPASGSVRIGGRVLCRQLRHLIGYATQHEVFHSQLTLRQMLKYTAELKLPRGISSREKNALIDYLLKLLDLDCCQDTVIGSISERGLSGGEKKRANIACELLTNPPLLLLDEPTSGLDSVSALDLIRLLKSIGEKYRQTIIMAIHQPSAEMCDHFEKFLFLCRGRITYPVCDKESMNMFISSFEEDVPCLNPTDIMLKHIQNRMVHVRRTSQGYESHDSSAESPGSDFGSYDNHENNNDGDLVQVITINPTSIDKESSPHKEDVDSGCDTCSHGSLTANESSFSVQYQGNGCSSDRWKASYYTQVKTLVSRNFLLLRPEFTSRLTWVQTVGLAIMASLLWFQLERSEENVKAIQGWIFFSSTYWMLHIHFQALSVFPSEKEIFRRERLSCLYRISAYYLSKTISELPMAMLFPAVYFLISYVSLGVSSTIVIFAHLSMVLLNSIAAQSVGLLVSVVCTSTDQCWKISSLITLFMQLFGGFFNTNIPSWLSWTKYLSIVRYAYHNMNIIEFHYGTPIQCSELNSRYASCVNGSRIVEVSDILSEANITEPILVNTCGLLIYLLVARILVYIILRRTHQPLPSR